MKEAQLYLKEKGTKRGNFLSLGSKKGNVAGFPTVPTGSCTAD